MNSKCTKAMAVSGEYYPADENNSLRFPDFVITAGAIALIVCLVGLIGAVKENRFLLFAFSVFLVVSLILQIVISGLFFAVASTDNEEAILTTIETMLTNSVNRTKNNEFNFPAADHFQAAYECCGVTDKQVYTDKFQGLVPQSCCSVANGTCDEVRGNLIAEEDAFEDGCADALLEFFRGLFVPVAAFFLSGCNWIGEKNLNNGFDRHVHHNAGFRRARMLCDPWNLLGLLFCLIQCLK